MLLLGPLDVLHEYACAGFRRAPCIHATLRRLATESDEKCGLAVDVLREALHSPTEGHRKIALEGLAATGSQEFAPLFRKALEDSKDSVVLAAIDGLVQIHDRSSLPGLHEMLKSVDTKFVKEAAAGAIVQLGGSHDAAKLEPLLEKGLDQDRYGYTRIFAAGAIIGLLHS